ncbi:hypothetical protein MKZ38_008410 [Zalerion maritima]|uniref:DUF7053 domain-containing protein n=1 Tax=Zalerion maritima TaxID=339359 RepID=A0AAD5RHL6_9PEZI|nr:hypothetical protein MKZ38_008410 [Zalerion maritima]
MAHSLFGGNNIVHTTPIPAGVPQEKAVAALFHDHKFFIACNPHQVDYKEKPTAEVELPEAVQALRTGEPTKIFTVTDRVHTLPAGIWDSDVISTYEFTNLKNGVFVRIKSPLSIVMDTTWEIRKSLAAEGDEEEEEAGLVISEDMNLSCSMFLAPIVRSQVENGWKGIHAKMCEKLKA